MYTEKLEKVHEWQLNYIPPFSPDMSAILPDRRSSQPTLKNSRMNSKDKKTPGYLNVTKSRFNAIVDEKMKDKFS